MTKNDAERMDGTSVVEKGLGVLDRAWDAQWALRLICLVLFLDMAMMLRTGRGLWQWSDGDRALLGDVGWIALILVGFSFVVAIVIPVVLNLLRLMSMIILGWLPDFPAAPDNRPYQRRLGCAPAREFHDLALGEKDEFLYRLYQADQREKRAESQSRERAGGLTAAALLVALADWLVARRMPDGIGVVDAIVGALGDWAFIIVPVVLLCAGAIVKWAWFADTPPNEIYYPPLDRELREKERRVKEIG